MPTAPRRFGSERTAANRKVQEQRRGTAQERGYNWRWTKYSEWFRRQPENVLCACGCGEVSKIVDHVEAVEGPSDPRFWDMANHQAMAKECHNRKSVRFDGAYGRAPDRSPAAVAELKRMKEAAAVRAEVIQARTKGRFDA